MTDTKKRDGSDSLHELVGRMLETRINATEMMKQNEGYPVSYGYWHGQKILIEALLSEIGVDYNAPNEKDQRQENGETNE